MENNYLIKQIEGLTEMLATLMSFTAPVSRLVIKLPSRMRLFTILKRDRAVLGTLLKLLWPRSSRVRFRPDMKSFYLMLMLT